MPSDVESAYVHLVQAVTIAEQLGENQTRAGQLIVDLCGLGKIDLESGHPDLARERSNKAMAVAMSCDWVNPGVIQEAVDFVRSADGPDLASEFAAQFDPDGFRNS